MTVRVLQDSILKEAVRASVPEEKFALISSNPNLDIEVCHQVLLTFLTLSLEMPEEEQPRGLFSVNLMVLWSSPPIYACNDDLLKITNQLVVEIYRKKEINKAEEDTIFEDENVDYYRKKDNMFEDYKVDDMFEGEDY